jgi:hypothetical protein
VPPGTADRLLRTAPAADAGRFAVEEDLLVALPQPLSQVVPDCGPHRSSPHRLLLPSRPADASRAKPPRTGISPLPQSPRITIALPLFPADATAAR